MKINQILNEKPNIDSDIVKQRVIRTLQKRQSDDPVFDTAYKLLVGPQLEKRIETYIAAHKDPDIGAEEMKWLIKTIPQLGTAEEVKTFVNDWNKGKEFIDIDKLIPQSGMTSATPLTDIVPDGVPKKLFIALSKENFTKSDAGPAEAALAIMSKRITYSTEGGDLIINGKKIEIKSGGKGGSSGGGRIYNDKHYPNQAEMGKVLADAGFKGNVSVMFASQPLPENFPKKEFADAVGKAFFNKVVPQINSKMGKPEFRTLWNNLMYDDYQKAAGHQGVLIIGPTTYQYIMNGDQLMTVKQTAKGMLYYSNMKKPRELGIQIALG